MDLVGDRRGQSIQIGAILLFGVLIIAFSSYQAFVVPNQNRGVEYSHNQEVQSDMQDLRNAIVSVPGSTSSQAVSVELSTRYPTRLVARNPGPPSGSLQTDGTTSMQYNITVRNAAADGETGDIWNGTARPYNTGAIAYTPNYNVYDNAPTTYYGQSVAYNQFRTANLTLSEQAMVNGRDITLVAINGSLSRSSGGTTSVDVRPVSRADDPIVVTNDTASSQVSVSVPTRLPQSVWEELLADEIDDSPGDLNNDRYVADVTTADGPGSYYNLTVTFEQGANYRLRMAKAGVGSGVTSESEAYLTDVRGDGSSVSNDTTTDLVLEVRDEYNNPVQDVTVSGGVDPSSAGSLTESESVSGSDGQVTFEYDANGVTPGSQQLNFSYRGLDGNFDGTALENVTMNVQVTSSSGGSSGSDGGDGDPLPGGAVSFDDLNGNGVYDEGEDGETYTEQEITDGFNENVNLVIGEDVSDQGELNIEADTVTIQDGVALESTNNKITVETTNGDITNSGMVSAKNEVKFTTSGNDIDSSEGTIESTNNKITLTTDSGGDIDVSDSDVTAKNEIKLTTDSGGNIDASGSTIESTNNKVTLTTSSGGNLNVANGDVKSKDEINLVASGGGDIDISSARTQNNGGCASADTGGGGTIDVSQAQVENSGGNGGILNANGTIQGTLLNGETGSC